MSILKIINWCASDEARREAEDSGDKRGRRFRRCLDGDEGEDHSKNKKKEEEEEE